MEMEERKVYAVYWVENGIEEIIDFSSPEDGAMLIFTDRETAELKKKEAEEDLFGAKIEETHAGNGSAVVREITLKFA
jgi:hypothetical protein